MRLASRHRALLCCAAALAVKRAEPEFARGRRRARADPVHSVQRRAPRALRHAQGARVSSGVARAEALR